MTTPISFELAKLLKEKGFDEPCRFVHDNWDNIEDWYDMGGEYHRNSEKNLSVYYSAPTIAEVIMWLYEKHGVWIFILPQDKSVVDFRVETSKFPSLPLFILIVKYEMNQSVTEVLNSSDPNSNLFLHFDEPSEAYESAIEYCLTNLI